MAFSQSYGGLNYEVYHQTCSFGNAFFHWTSIKNVCPFAYHNMSDAASPTRVLSTFGCTGHGDVYKVKGGPGPGAHHVVPELPVMLGPKARARLDAKRGALAAVRDASKAALREELGEDYRSATVVDDEDFRCAARAGGPAARLSCCCVAVGWHSANV